MMNEEKEIKDYDSSKELNSSSDHQKKNWHCPTITSLDVVRGSKGIHSQPGDGISNLS